MGRPTRTLAALALTLPPTLFLPATQARAEEPAITLRAGHGQEVTQNNCGVCHSLDYIKMNAPFLTGEQWKSEVTKMRQAYGAPIEDADALAIIAYLTSAYGPPAN